MPWFGGKRRVANVLWSRFDPTVTNYVEPFAGSLAVLLARPGGAGRWETVNDLDDMLVNLWRSIKRDPDAVARHADFPIVEAEYQARRYWIVTEGAARVAALVADPDAYDPRVAGYYLHGLACHIGRNYADDAGPWQEHEGRWVQRGDPDHVDDAPGIIRALPRISWSAGTGVRDLDIRATMKALADRLRYVRVTSGDFERVLGPAATTEHGMTAVLLDPPYATQGRQAGLYRHDDGDDVAARARQWAVDHGDDPRLRIALCGYDDVDMPPGWSCHRWTATGGFGNQSKGRGRANRSREVLWFSPACLPAPAE